MTDREERIRRVLENLWPGADIEFFTGDVVITETVFDPKPATLSTFRDADESEFPQVKVVHP